MTLLDAATALLEAINVLGYTFKHPLQRDFEAALEAEQQRQERVEAVLLAAKKIVSAEHWADGAMRNKYRGDEVLMLDRALAALEVPVAGTTEGERR